MPQEPQQLAANEWGAISYYPQWDTLELRWDASTRSMTDNGFRATLQMLADQGLKVRPKYMIVDSMEFFHQLGEGTLAWRDEHIVPLYNDAGVEKGAEPAPDGPAAFPTGWFETRERMYAWLTGGTA